jgi:hypothetical protein
VHFVNVPWAPVKGVNSNHLAQAEVLAATTAAQRFGDLVSKAGSGRKKWVLDIDEDYFFPNYSPTRLLASLDGFAAVLRETKLFQYDTFNPPRGSAQSVLNRIRIYTQHQETLVDRSVRDVVTLLSVLPLGGGKGGRAEQVRI